MSGTTYNQDSHIRPTPCVTDRLTSSANCSSVVDVVFCADLSSFPPERASIENAGSLGNSIHETGRDAEHVSASIVIGGVDESALGLQHLLACAGDHQNAFDTLERRVQYLGSQHVAFDELHRRHLRWSLSLSPFDCAVCNVFASF
jgi:hypothetical protein